MTTVGKPLRRLCVIGVGLIGGSLARALRESGQVQDVVGCGRGVANLERALELGVIDRFETDPATAVVGADMVLLAVPLGAMEQVMAAIAPTLEPDCIVTDGGSAKASVVQAARRQLGPALPRFVPGHPIAGTENSGVEASFAELYRGRKVILTPLEETAGEAVAAVQAMWESCGARVSCMSVTHHDEVLAATSHMPHVLAFALVDALSRWGDRDEIFAYAAGGFRDFTRIASSDPLMWRDICLANHESVVAALERYTDDLVRMTEAVRRQDGEALEQAFRNARDARERFLAMLES